MKKKQENHFLLFVGVFLVCLGYFGWFTAELDNKILRKEILTIKYKALTQVAANDIHKYSND